MKVYTVFYDFFGEHALAEIYATKEAAEKCAALYNERSDGRYVYEVDEWEVKP